MLNKIRTAAVGLGWVSQNRHLPVMHRNDHYDVVAIIDRDKNKLEKLRKYHSYQHVVCAKTPNEFTHWNDLDALVIALPPFEHSRWSIAALEQGKAVLTEKPFAHTVKDGNLMVDAAKQNKRPLSIIHNFQFSNAARNAKKIIKSGKYGNIVSISAVQFGNPKRRLPTWYEELPLGLFFDESPHLLYLLEAFIPRDLVRKNSLVFKGNEVNTPAYVNAIYEGHRYDGQKIPIELSLRFNSPVSEWYLILFLENRLIVLDIFRDIFIQLPNDGNHDIVNILTSSLTSTFQHWWQHIPNGWDHIFGKMFYGNDHLFQIFYEIVRDNVLDHELIGFSMAQKILKMQFDIINKSQFVD